MIRIRTPSRLHFGLFSLPSAPSGAAAMRNFGGVGLMIDQPGIELTVAEAKAWSADGPLAVRALHFAQAYCASLGMERAFQLHVQASASEHAGLGTGTQLGLAVARAIGELTGQRTDSVTLAKHVGRGLRSALGVHGFERGGFLVEGGKKTDTAIAPLLVRHDFPDDWRILLITPRNLAGTHGRREIEAFADLATLERNERRTDELCRLVLLGMLPALVERDLNVFSEALYEFNRQVGEMFQPAQGGVYAHPRIEEIVMMLRKVHIHGVGQSSWGPTIFVIVAVDQAVEIGDWLVDRKGIAREEIVITSACNHGAVVMK
jgi:beta-RFAP synthase